VTHRLPSVRVVTAQAIHSRKRLSTSHSWVQRASKAPLEPQVAFHGVTGTKVLAFNGHWDNLDLGHCGSGVWSTGRCCTCMALPTLYYFTVLSPPWIQALNLVAQCAQRGPARPLFIYHFTIFTTISLFVVPGYMQPRDEEDSQTQASHLIQTRLRKSSTTVDRSGPGQPYINR
jgi:hypothetical protein